MNERVNRQSNLELLRIVSMILIIIHHFYVHGNIILDYDDIKIREVIMQWLASAGKIGVNLFIMTTGYFMINSKFKMKKLLKIEGQVLFYSVFIFLICKFAFKMNLGIKDGLISIFPVMYNNYWFITTYILLYIFSNYINKFIKSISQKEFSVLIILLITIFSILPSVVNAKFQYSDFGWFIILYLIGAYIKIYGMKIKIFDNKERILLIMLLSILAFISIYVLDKMYFILKIDPLKYSTPLHQLIPFSISLLMFNFFCNLKVKNSRIINKVASCTLGVYLIHDNRFFKSILWLKIVKTNIISQSKYSIIFEFLAVAIIFCGACILEIIRQNTFEKAYMKIIDKNFNKCVDNAKNIYGKIKKHIKLNKETNI